MLIKQTLCGYFWQFHKSKIATLPAVVTILQWFTLQNKVFWAPSAVHFCALRKALMMRKTAAIIHCMCSNALSLDKNCFFIYTYAFAKYFIAATTKNERKKKQSFFVSKVHQQRRWYVWVVGFCVFALFSHLSTLSGKICICVNSHGNNTGNWGQMKCWNFK